DASEDGRAGERQIPYEIRQRKDPERPHQDEAPRQGRAHAERRRERDGEHRPGHGPREGQQRLDEPGAAHPAPSAEHRPAQGERPGGGRRPRRRPPAAPSTVRAPRKSQSAASARRVSEMVSTMASRSSPFNRVATIWVGMTRNPPPKM